MGHLIHVANLFILGSFLARDILWLRVLSILGGFAFIGYFGYAFPEPIWPPILWNCVFTVINLYQIFQLVLERRPVFLDERQRQLHAMAFRELSPRQLVQLLAPATWQAVETEPIVATGTTPDCLTLLTDGTAVVRVQDAVVAELSAGHFVGEMAWLTGQPASADVLPSGTVQVVRWRTSVLRALLEQRPDLAAAVQHQLSMDLAGKLRAPQAIEIGP